MGAPAGEYTGAGLQLAAAVSWQFTCSPWSWLAQLATVLHLRPGCGNSIISVSGYMWFQANTKHEAARLK
jgi:hypothetical protein